MIVCVSPSSQHYDETHNTLKYANRAKNIKTKVSRNIINVNRHVSQYVKAIYDLRQEVDSLKGRLKDATKEAADKINKQRASKDASIKEGIRRLRAASEQSRDARQDRAQLLRNLRLIERRILVVSAWLEAFDQVFEARQHEEEPPAFLCKMRSEADKVLRELANNEQMVKQRLAGPSWEKAIDSALQNSLRNLQSIEGVTDADIVVLTTEANLLRVTAERDVLQALASDDTDISTCTSSLARAHFETYATISKIINTDITEAEALESARRSLFEIQKGTGDAVSHVVKPSGELVSEEVYQPSAYTSPRKKKQHFGYGAGYSPFKHSNGNSNNTITLAPPPPGSPVRSPRPIKAKSPKKGVLFSKKNGEKKRVRWNEELEDPVSEDSKRRVVIDDSYFPGPADEELAPPPQLSFHTTSRAHSPPLECPVAQGVMAPPIRPRNKMLEPLGSKPKEPPGPAVADDSLENSPLHACDAVEQVINRLGTEGLASGVRQQCRGGAGPSSAAHHRAAMRRSVAGGAMPSLRAKRRSPSNSSTTSPENGMVWKTGHTKRLPSKGEKENGSVNSVLSPKSTGIKANARRMTVTAAGVQGLSALAQARLPALLSAGVVAGAGREGIVGKTVSLK